MASIEMVDNPADGTSNPAGHLHAAEVDNITRALNGAGVLSYTYTLTVTGSDRKVTFPAFNYIAPDGAGGLTRVTHAGGDATVTAAHATKPRTDLIVADKDGNISVTAGTATTETGNVEEAPEPALGSDEILCAKVRVEANTANIGTDKVLGRAIDVTVQGTGTDFLTVQVFS